MYFATKEEKCNFDKKMQILREEVENLMNKGYASSQVIAQIIQANHPDELITVQKIAYLKFLIRNDLTTQYIRVKL